MVKFRQRHGSKAFRPHIRAASQMPSVNFWPESQEKKLLGFAGYKAGMTHYQYIENANTPAKGLEVAMAGTVVEVPPMTVWGIRAYDRNGTCLGDIICSDENVLKQINHASKTKKSEKKSPAFESDPSSASSVFALCFATPALTATSKKTPDTMEIAIGGKDAKEKLEYAKTILGKQVNFADVFKAGELVDTISITKGKGTQGVIKRFGISKQRRKATGKVRHVGTLGPWTPSYVMYTALMAGRMGYNKRTDLNKQVIKVGKPEEINPKGGFVSYGNVNTAYVLLRGSVSGPKKRLIRFRKASRPTGIQTAPQVTYVSLES
ncbi:MAG TPA: 50S ribosomal protein L3, partial [Candidatus Micrarchaeota archaeon]|nr:50S ribosomal protein L3 [Candidatus Micrarchaeota archaeon]